MGRDWDRKLLKTWRPRPLNWSSLTGSKPFPSELLKAYQKFSASDEEKLAKKFSFLERVEVFSSASAKMIQKYLKMTKTRKIVFQNNRRMCSWGSHSYSNLITRYRQSYVNTRCLFESLEGWTAPCFPLHPSLPVAAREKSNWHSDPF